MHIKDHKIFLGLFIILIGVLLLLNSIHLFSFDDQIWWGIAFGALGIVFLNVYRQNKLKKGPLVAGIIFLLIGIFSILDSLNIISDGLIGAFILWVFAALFFSIYAHHNNRWWAIIPGGACLISGSLNLIEEFGILDEFFYGFIFLLGMSLVFWFLYLIRDEQNKLEWTKVFALILLVAAFFVLANNWHNRIAEILFPLSIIFCGGFLIISGLLKNKKTE